MDCFGRFREKIDHFLADIDTKIHLNIDKFIEKHAHHGSAPAHYLAKRSLDLRDDGGSHPPAGDAAMIGASDNDVTVVGVTVGPHSCHVLDV